MNAKILVPIVVALCGCASAPPLTADSSTPFDCTSNTCEVPITFQMIGTIGAPDIKINAGPTTVVRITFVVNSWFGARFPDDGITVSPFRCALESGSTTRILCEGTNLERKDYKYSVRLRAGIATPWPLDPFIKN